NGLEQLLFHPRRPVLAVRSWNNLQQFDLSTGKELPEIDVSLVDRALDLARSSGRSMAYHPDGHVLALAVNQNSQPRVLIWDLERARPLVALEGHRLDTIALAFHPSGDLLLSFDPTNRLRVWDWRAGKLVFQANLGWWQLPRMSRDGRFIASPDERDGKLK